MLVRRAPEVSRQDTPDAALPAPSLQRKRLTSVLRASWHIFRNRRLASSHRPPEMHALDHLAKYHTKVFV